MSRDFVGTARLKLSPLCTLPFFALQKFYEKILMRIDVTADRLYAKPRLGMIPTSWGFLFLPKSRSSWTCAQRLVSE
jgi:hypothetical protein